MKGRASELMDSQKVGGVNLVEVLAKCAIS